MANTRDYTDRRQAEYNTPGGFGARLRSDGYNIGSYSYPDGLGVSADLQHYVTFFINQRGKSKFKYDTNSKATPSAAGGTSIRNNINNSGTGTSLVFGASVAAGALGVGSATASLLGVSVGKTQAAPGTPGYELGKAFASAATKTIAFAGVSVVAAEALKNTKVLESDKTERIKDVITLHMQERPSVSYGMNYQDRDMGILGGFLGADTAASENLDTSRNTGLMASLALQFAKLPSILPGLGNPADIIQLGAKVKTNPFREVFFEGIDYRKFNFRYKFMPKSENEVLSVYKIIDKFKEHMHPEIAAGGAFFLYPSEFEIAYYYNNKENGYFNKIATCALTDMSVEYGGEQLSTFANGAPSEINLTLSFRELELITKESIKSRGY